MSESRTDQAAIDTDPGDAFVLPWFLLFDGTSSDGRGPAAYCGRTTDIATAERYLQKFKAGPYSVGGVRVATDTEFRLLGTRDFQTLRERYGLT